MDTKNVVITSISFTVLIAVLFVVGFYTVKYLQQGYKNQPKTVAEAPKVEILTDEKQTSNKNNSNEPDSTGITADNGSVMGTKTTTKTDSYGISDQAKPVTKPSTLPTTGTSTTTKKTTTDTSGFSSSSSNIVLNSSDFVISKPKVKDADDDYKRFDYTFSISSRAKEYLSRTGFSYFIDAENCRDFFEGNDYEKVFEGSSNKGYVSTGFSVELPEESLSSDNGYLEKSNYDLEVNGKVVLSGTVYVPACE